MKCRFNTEYLMSCEAIASFLVLGTGGGIIGITARNTLMGIGGQQDAASIVGEALLFVAVFAWVTTLLDFFFNICDRKVFHPDAQLVFTLLMFLFYAAVTVAWAIMRTFPISTYGKAFIVFVLAVATTAGYLWMAIGAIREVYEAKKEECDDKKKKDDVVVEEVVVEEGKAEPSKAEEKAEEEATA